MSVSLWDHPENVEALKRMVAEGKSSSQIGAILRVSRNSIIGKVHRIGLVLGEARERERALRKVELKPVKRKLYEVSQKSAAAARRRAKIAALKAMAPPLPPPEGGVSIFALNLTTCRYPINAVPQGQMDHTVYCGGEVRRGVYCLDHAAVCFQARKAA